MVVVLAAIIAFTDATLTGPSGADQRDCEPIAFKHNGIPWEAANIRTADLSCDEAASVIRAYAKPRNCQFRPSCVVGTYHCRTETSEGSTFIEHCTRDHRSVRWHGSYVTS